MFIRTGELDKPVPKEQPPPETLRQQDRSEQQNSGERCASIGRRDSDLRQKDRGGIMVWAVFAYASQDAGRFNADDMPVNT